MEPLILIAGLVAGFAALAAIVWFVCRAAAGLADAFSPPGLPLSGCGGGLRITPPAPAIPDAGSVFTTGE